MRKVFITRQFPQTILKYLTENGLSVDIWNSEDPVDYNYMVQKSKDVEGILCTLNDNINESFITSSSSLKVISTMSVGFDHIDIKCAKLRNLKIGYTPGVLTDATAELAVSLLLLVSRRLIESIECVKNGLWSAWKPFWLCGQGLKNSTVGIIGLGMIGKAIAERLVPFGVKEILTSGSSRKKSIDELTLQSKFLVKSVDLKQLLTQSDFIVVSCSLTDQTHQLINTNAFNNMKSNAILINISRGAVVDQEALYSALANKKIAAAGLDVCTPEPLPTDHKLLSLPNCVVLPHIGSATTETRLLMAKLAADNLICGLQDKAMPSPLIY